MNKSLLLYSILTVIFYCPCLPFAFADNTTADPSVQSSASTIDPTADNNDDKNWEYSQSIKYSRGKYGTTQESETYEEDAVLQRDFDNADLSITIPALWQTGNVTATDSGREIIKKKVVKTSSSTNINPTITGIGDINLNGDYYLLEESKNAPLDVTLTGYIKAPTASKKNALGTGAWDGGPGLGFTKKIIDNIKAIADASEIFDGKSSGERIYNSTSLDGGLEYDITPKVTATVKYEWSTPSSAGSSTSKQIALSVDYKINDDWKLNGEATFGLSDGAAAETYLLGATVYFDGGFLGILPMPDSSPSDQTDYRTATSPFEKISDRILSDPLYLPLKGQVYGLTAYTYGAYSLKTYNYTGAILASSKAYNNAFTQVTGYGISDRLSAQLSGSYDFYKTSTTAFPTDIKSVSETRGPTNITIGTNYRLFDQSDFPADIDLALYITPNSFESKDAGNGQNGTVASGAQPVTFTTGIGREMQAFTIMGSFTTSYIGNRYYESLAAVDYNHLNQEYFDYTFALNTQTRFTDRLSLNLGANYTINDDMFDTNLSTGTKDNAVPANSFGPTAALNYHFIPNRLVGSLTYAYIDYSTGKNNFAAVTSDIETKNHNASIFGARMQYLF